MESSLYQSIYSDGMAVGEAKGEAKALIRLLSKRVQVPSDVKDAILALAKERPEAVNQWFDEAILASDPEAALRLVRKITGT